MRAVLTRKLLASSKSFARTPLRTTRTTAKKTNLDWKVEARRQELAAEKAVEVLDACGYSIPIDPIRVAAYEGKARLRMRGADLGSAFDGQLEYHRSKA